MSTIRYSVSIESLPAEACPEVAMVLDGIRYRAKFLTINARSFRARMLEPFQRDFSLELPLFVLAMTSFRFVREGRPTPEALQGVRSHLEQVHQGERRRAAVEAVWDLEGEQLRTLAAEARIRLAALGAEAGDLEGRISRLRADCSRAESRIRREIQEGVKARRYSHDEGLRMLQDAKAIEAAAWASAPALREECRRMEARLAEVRAAEPQVEAAYRAETGLELRDVEAYLYSL